MEYNTVLERRSLCEALVVMLIELNRVGEVRIMVSRRDRDANIGTRRIACGARITFWA